MSVSTTSTCIPRSNARCSASVSATRGVTNKNGTIRDVVDRESTRRFRVEVPEIASELGLGFDAVNSNTFQDQAGQALSYKFGSLCHTDPGVRRQAVEHHLHVIDVGRTLGSDAITVWLADGKPTSISL